MEKNKLKVCVKCGRELPLTEFFISKKSKDGLQSYCKECSKSAVYKRRQSFSSYPILPNGQEPREVIQEIRKRISLLKSVGFEYEGDLYF